MSMRDRWRRRLRLLAGALIFAAVAGVAVVVWAAPRGHVPLPGPDAAPQQVVRAYVSAIDVRDFRTANRLCGHPQVCAHGRFEGTPQMANLRLKSPIDLKTDALGRGTLAGDYREAFWVPVRFDLSHGDASQPDGPTVWGYLVARNADTEPWRIVDQGVL